MKPRKFLIADIKKRQSAFLKANETRDLDAILKVEFFFDNLISTSSLYDGGHDNNQNESFNHVVSTKYLNGKSSAFTYADWRAKRYLISFWIVVLICRAALEWNDGHDVTTQLFNSYGHDLSRKGAAKLNRIQASRDRQRFVDD